MEEATVQSAKPTETQIRRMKRNELIKLANEHEIPITQSESVRRLKNLITEHLYADEDEEEEQEVEESGDCNDVGSNHSSAGSMEIAAQERREERELAAQERREKEERELAAQERREERELAAQERREKEERELAGKRKGRA